MQKPIFTFIQLPFLLLLTCTTGDRNNPVDANGTAYINNLNVSMTSNDTTFYINDTLSIAAVCDNPSILKYYEWKSDSNVTINKFDTLLFFPSSPGKMTVSLRAIDIYKRESPWVTKMVQVKSGIPVVTLNNDTELYVSDSVEIKTSAYDTNGRINRYVWSWSGSNSTDTAISVSHLFTWSESGVKRVVVWAIDDDGQVSLPDTCLVTVLSDAPVPVPVKDTSVSLSNSVACIIAVSATTHNKSPENLFWFWDTGDQGWDDSTKESKYSFMYPAGGKLRVIWAARDEKRQFSENDTFFINFNRPPDPPKLLQPGTDTALWTTFSYLTGKGSVLFLWDGTDPDGVNDIRTFKFTLTSETGTTVESYYGNIKSDTVLNLDTLKTYSWRLISRDSIGDSSVATGNILTSYGIPIIIDQPQNYIAVKGDSAYLFVNATGRLLSYSWLKDDVVIPSASQPIYVKSLTDYSDSGLYRCKITNPSGSTLSNLVKLTVKPTKPFIISQPHDTTVIQGGRAEFSVVASGDNVKYTWQINGIDFQQPNASSKLAIDTCPIRYNGQKYRCIISNISGADTSFTATLHVNISPPVIVTSPTSVKANEGDNTTLRVSAKGDSLCYQWFKNGNVLSGMTFSTLNLSNVTSSDNGSYSCKVSNSAGIIESGKATIEVAFNGITGKRRVRFSSGTRYLTVHLTLNKTTGNAIGSQCILNYETTCTPVVFDVSFFDNGSKIGYSITNPRNPETGQSTNTAIIPPHDLYLSKNAYGEWMFTQATWNQALCTVEDVEE